MSVAPPVDVVCDDPDERSMAALAHSSIILNTFAPGLGVVAALAVWLTQRDRSAYVGRQALQATIYQLCWLIVPVLLAIIGGLALLGGAIGAAVADVRVGFAFTPLAIVAFLAAAGIGIVGLLYALVAAYETFHGRDFRYLVIGNVVH